MEKLGKFRKKAYFGVNFEKQIQKHQTIFMIMQPRRNVLRLLLAFFLLFSLTGCFEISEEITLKKNGSGTYAFTLDMSQIVSMAKAFEEAAKDSTDTEEEKNTKGKDEELFADSEEGLAELEAVAGITNVTQKADSEEGILSFSFDFRDIDALNAAFKAMSKNSEEGKALKTDVFAYKKGKLVRKPAENFMVDNIVSSAAEGAGGDDSQSEMVKSMFKSGKYTLRIKVPRKVRKFDNEVGNIINENEVLMEVSLDQLMEHSEYIDYTLKYK